MELFSLHLSPSLHKPPLHSSYCFVLPDKVTAGIREESVTQIKDKVIATTLTQKGFCKGSTLTRCNNDCFLLLFLDPVLKKKEMLSINHLPNGNDRIILPGG